MRLFCCRRWRLPAVVHSLEIRWFIAFLISRFKYISQLENWFRNRKTKNEQAVTETVAEEPAADEEEIDETDDLALVAVITAALAASLETSPDKLIVRSIRRKNTNRW